MELSNYRFDKISKNFKSYKQSLLGISLTLLCISFLIVVKWPQYQFFVLYFFAILVVSLSLMGGYLVAERRRTAEATRAYIRDSMTKDVKNIQKHYFENGGKFWSVVLKSPASSSPLEQGYKEEVLVGTIALDRKSETEYELRRCTVDKKFRRFKIGTKLVQYLLTEAKKLGAKKVVLDTTNFQDPAIRLYRSLGFKTVKRVHMFYTVYDVFMEYHV